MRWYVDPSRVGTLKEIPAEIRSTYTQNSSKLVIEDPIIQKAVAAALAGETNPYWMAWKSTSISRGLHALRAGSAAWNVAPTVLERGSGSWCVGSILRDVLAMCTQRQAGLPSCS